MSNNKNFIQNFISVLQKIEDGILIGLLLLMIFLAVIQISLRNLFDSGILWGDPLIRLLVLWIGLMGAMIASRNDHHISIDVISRYLPEQLKKLTKLLTSIFTAFICSAMTYYSFVFVMMEKEDGLIAFGNIPAWICESIIPISFAVISIRYVLNSLTCINQLFRRIPQ
mgnify:CR=1 FL=1